MANVSQYTQDELVVADFKAATAVPVGIGAAHKTFDQLITPPRYQESLIDLVAVGTGASTCIVQPWLWNGQLQQWYRAGIGWTGIPGAFNQGAAITGTNGFTWSEPIWRVGAGQAIYMQAISPANLTTLAAYIRHRVT